MDLGLSLLNCLGHNSECMDVCGCLCAISNPEAASQGDWLRHFQPWSVGLFSSCLRSLDSKGHYAELLLLLIVNASTVLVGES